MVHRCEKPTPGNRRPLPRRGLRALALLLLSGLAVGSATLLIVSQVRAVRFDFAVGQRKGVCQLKRGVVRISGFDEEFLWLRQSGVPWHELTDIEPPASGSQLCWRFSDLGGGEAFYILFPLWIPLAVFSAILLLMLVRVPLRSRYRRRRGQCAPCGYSLRGNVTDLCPECGAPVTSPSIPSTAPRLSHPADR